MRAFVPEYDLMIPRDLPEALNLLDRDPGAWRPLAGGTDLMVLFEGGKLADRKLVSIGGIKELLGFNVAAEHITIGAATTYTEIRHHPAVRAELPLLAEAASVTGSIANQNRGTIGGNIVNASPAADSSPALLAYDAELELVSARGSRVVPYSNFHTGYKTMLLRPDELVARIRFPRRTQNFRHYFRKVGTRNAQAISKVCMAATALMERRKVMQVRIALGSVAPTAIRCRDAEAELEGKEITRAAIAAARKAIMDEIHPIDDFRSTAAYRRHVAGNLLEEFLRTLLSNAGQH